MAPKADKISDMRNLGPAVEKDMHAAGVFSATEVRKLGVEQAFLKMLDGRQKAGRSAKCCNALYLCAIDGAIHDLDRRDLSEDLKEEFRSYTSKLRKTGGYG